ncbi:MAG: hypothetical protein JXQ73_16080 [Phycisphaerae bacterium]|nr:hypothetical protein [Phycisphaerae bacterium]
MTAEPPANESRPQADSPAETASDLARRPFWWRFLGLVTIIVALFTAHTVWIVNRHVSRLELARIFATAMSRPRVYKPTSQVTDRPTEAPIRRPKLPKPPTRRIPPRPAPTPPKDEAPPFSMDPSAWIHPADEPTTRPQPRIVVSRPKPAPKPKLPPAPKPATVESGASVDPLSAQMELMQKASVSEVTRQTWALLSLLMLECLTLAGLSALLDARRARGNLLISAWLLLGGTALTVLAGRIITVGLGIKSLAENPYLRPIAEGAGFPPLAGRDYAQVVVRGGGYAVILLVLLMLPPARRYGRALRRRIVAGQLKPWLSGPVCCSLLFLLAIGASVAPAFLERYVSVFHVLQSGVAQLKAGAVGALQGIGAGHFSLSVATWFEPWLSIGSPMGSELFGTYVSVPEWHIIRKVLIVWSIPATVAALLALTGRRLVLRLAYVVGILGVLVQLACWGAPYAAVGTPDSLETFLIVLPLHLIALGRIRACLAAKRSGAPAHACS